MKLKVPEWLGLSFKNSWELNNLVDTHLPGQPLFQQKDILVSNKVCELFFQDIIQCIRALFRDPDFAPYLIFTPKRHYADNNKEEMIYHDMYTGAWWRFMQVSMQMINVATMPC